MACGGFFNTTVSGTGTAAINVVGKPVVLDCSQQPTYVDTQAAVCWSADLVPGIHNAMNMKSMLRGGSGEAFQYAFHGPGSSWSRPTSGRRRRRASRVAAADWAICSGAIPHPLGSSGAPRRWVLAVKPR